MNEDVTYHGMGIVSFVTIDGVKLMRLQDEDNNIVWFHTTMSDFTGDINAEQARPLERIFKETVDMEIHQVQLAPNTGDERPEGSFLH